MFYCYKVTVTFTRRKALLVVVLTKLLHTRSRLLISQILSPITAYLVWSVAPPCNGIRMYQGQIRNQIVSLKPSCFPLQHKTLVWLQLRFRCLVSHRHTKNYERSAFVPDHAYFVLTVLMTEYNIYS